MWPGAEERGGATPGQLQMATPVSAGSDGSPVPAAGNAGDKAANDAAAAGDKGTKGAGNKGTYCDRTAKLKLKLS